MPRRKYDTNSTPGQAQPFERSSPSYLRARLRQENEHLGDLQHRHDALMIRLDDLHIELEQRDDSGLKKWYIIAAVCAVTGLLLMVIPGLFMTIIGICFMIAAVSFCFRYLSERRHIETYFQRLAQRINEYSAQETRLSEQINRHLENIDRIEILLSGR